MYADTSPRSEKFPPKHTTNHNYPHHYIHKFSTLIVNLGRSTKIGQDLEDSISISPLLPICNWEKKKGHFMMFEQIEKTIKAKGEHNI